MAKPELPAPWHFSEYPSGRDYPIRATDFAAVTLTDDFWKPKVDLNARVTIPHVWNKSSESGRGVNTTILEAAVHSLRTHPNPDLEARVEARIRALVEAQADRPHPDNGFFELAAARFRATGDRALLEAAVRSADAISESFRAETPAFSGGERDAINCLALFRATGDGKYLDLARFYLDIRGLENSVGRSRHNQSHRHVLEQEEAVGHAVNDASLMFSLAEAGVLSGLDAYFEAARRIWLDEDSSTPDGSGYVAIERTWRSGDVVEIDIPIEVRKITADPRVRDCAGRMALQRGPIVYCAEWPDFRGGSVLNARIDRETEFKSLFDPEHFGGAVVLSGEASDIRAPGSAARPIELIPYYLWANRGPGEMSVWLPMSEYEPGSVGPAGGLIFYVNPNHAEDGWRYLEAAPFDQSAGAPWGCFRSLIDGARGTAIGTGRQNTRDMLRGCRAREFRGPRHAG